jgi:hypothetical protein
MDAYLIATLVVILVINLGLGLVGFLLIVVLLLGSRSSLLGSSSALNKIIEQED